MFFMYAGRRQCRRVRERRRKNCIAHVLELWKAEHTPAHGAYSIICRGLLLKRYYQIT